MKNDGVDHSKRATLATLRRIAGTAAAASAIELLLASTSASGRIEVSNPGNYAVIPDLEVIPVFFGENYWSSSEGTELKDFIMTSTQAYLKDPNSPYKVLTQYGVQSGTLGNAKVDDPTGIRIQPDKEGVINLRDFEKNIDVYIANKIKDGELPKNRQFAFFFPPGFPVPLSGTYHDYTDGSQIPYCIFQFAGDMLRSPEEGKKTFGEIFGLKNNKEAYSNNIGHEFSEMATDPLLRGWFDKATGEEIADICELSGQHKLESPAGPVVEQSNWDERNGTCSAQPNHTENRVASDHANLLLTGAVAAIGTGFAAFCARRSKIKSPQDGSNRPVRRR